MDPRGGGPSGSNSLVPFASALGAMAPPGSRTVLTRTTTQTYVGGASAPPAAAPFSKLRDLAAKMSSDQALVAQQAKEAAAQLTRAEETRQKLAAEVAGLSKQLASLANENNNLVACNHELKTKAQTLQQTVHALQSVAQTHQHQVATCEAAVAKVAEFRDAAEAQLAALKQECEALVSRFDVAVSQERATSAEHVSRLRGMEAALQALTRERDQLSADLAAVKEQHTKALADAAGELRRAVGEAETQAGAKVAAAEAAAQETASAVARLTGEKDKLVGELQAVQERCDAAQGEARKVAGLHAQLIAAADTLREEQQKTVLAQEQAAAAMAEKEQLGEKLKALGEAHKKLGAKAAAAESASKAKGAKESSLQSELAKVTAAKEEAEQRSAGLAKQVEALESKEVDTALHMKKLIETAAAEQAAKMVEAAKAELEAGVQAKVDAGTADVRAKAEAEAAVEEELGKLKAALEAAVGQGGELRTSLAQATAAKEAALAQLTELQNAAAVAAPVTVAPSAAVGLGVLTATPLTGPFAAAPTAAGQKDSVRRNLAVEHFAPPAGGSVGPAKKGSAFAMMLIPGASQLETNLSPDPPPAKRTKSAAAAPKPGAGKRGAAASQKAGGSAQAAPLPAKAPAAKKPAAVSALPDATDDPFAFLGDF